MKTKYGTKTITIGEKAYGREAIDHIKRVLEQKTINNG
jgi:hypothetical protein